MLPEGLLLGSTEQYFQSFEAGPFMGAAPSALIPGQGDDQGRNCRSLLPRDQLCVTQGIGRAVWSSHKVTRSCYIGLLRQSDSHVPYNTHYRGVTQ